jgi:lysophospholipase L1-like esterase
VGKSVRHGMALVALVAVSLAGMAIGATGAQAATPATRSVDLVTTGTGDEGGYHLFEAAAASGWQWRALATIRPPGVSSVTWTGQQCTTGDGRHVVVVMAPRELLSRAAIADAGALSFAVDTATGSVRPLVTGVAERYFTPGCGAGSRVVLSRFLGSEESSTVLFDVDSASGRVLGQVQLAGEVTGAVPAVPGILALRGRTLVRIAGSSSPAQERTVAVLPGTPDRLLPGSAQGAHVVTVDGGGLSVWSVDAAGTIAHVGDGPRDGARLLQGRAGSDLVVGVTADPAGVGAGGDLRLLALPAGTSPGGVQGASLDGQVLLAAGGPAAAAPAPAPAPARKAAGTGAPPVARLVEAATGRVVADALPASGPAAAAGLPAPRAGSAPTSNTVNQTAPTCAVPRNDIRFQVPQPSGAQVSWAVQQAVRNDLRIPSVSRPAGYLNLGLPAYEPSTDFPAPLLHVPAGMSGTVPPQLMNGIMAQESNWSQASPHAARGTAGNPLIADYYGLVKTAGIIDFDLADCGYGIAQVTDFMTLASTAVPADFKTKVAEDYGENIAAGLQILGSKWNQLFDVGITIGDANPAKIENWYFAAWAYNSGVHPNDGAGNSGLGWANNPVNPMYDANRTIFGTSSADPAHPERWPYQEKVLGWIENPLIDPMTGSPLYRSVGFDGTLLTAPFSRFCTSANHCNPSVPSAPCSRSDLHCWWSSRIDSPCAFGCTDGSFDVSASAHEPASSNPFPPVCARETWMGGGALIVSTDPSPPDNLNLVGCSTRRSDGTFTAAFGGSTAPYQPGSIDWHQLDGGFGGHFFFTHTNSSVDVLDTIVGTWKPTGISGAYNVRAFVPSFGATTSHAHYEITPVPGGPTYVRELDQLHVSNVWLSLGFFTFSPGGQVTLTSVTHDGSTTNDVAYNAMAFVPMQSFSTLVSLGDSLAAGEGAPDSINGFDPGTDSFTATADPFTPDAFDMCHRTPNAYSRVYGAATPLYSGRPIVQLSCSGAVIANLNGRPATTANSASDARFFEGTQLENMPPRQFVNRITVSIGINDLGFAGIAQSCTLNRVTSCASKEKDPTTGGDKLSEAIQALYPRLLGLYTTLSGLTGGDVVVVAYPQVLLSPSVSLGNCPVAPFAPGDIPYLRDRESELNSVIRRAVAAAPANVKLLDEENAFVGHELCTALPYANNIDLSSATDPSKIKWFFHPNALGYARMASDLGGV